jgi:hypothetical protein
VQMVYLFTMNSGRGSKKIWIAASLLLPLFIVFAPRLLHSQNDAPAVHNSTVQEVASAAHGGFLNYLTRPPTSTQKWMGLIWILASLVVFALMPLLTKKVFSKEYVMVYRPYEHKLLQIGRLKLQDMKEYHGLYHWGDYGAISSSIVPLIIVTLLSAREKFDSTEIKIIAIICFLLVLSVLSLIWADLVHTNSQTPIIPIKKRFELIDLSVVFGTFGTMSLVLSTIAFLTLMNLWLVIFGSIMYVGIMAYTINKRRIPKKEFFQYFKISGTEGQDLIKAWNSKDTKSFWDKSDAPFFQAIKEEGFGKSASETGGAGTGAGAVSSKQNPITGNETSDFPYHKALRKSVIDYYFLHKELQGHEHRDTILALVRQHLGISKHESLMYLESLEKYIEDVKRIESLIKTMDISPTAKKILEDLAVLEHERALHMFPEDE